MPKKTIIYQSDYSMAKTGFGRVSKVLLDYLYKTGKYNIIHYCVGLSHSHVDLARTPWKSIGCLPDSQEEMNQINKDPNSARLCGYGAHLLDKVVFEYKPSVYIAAQDIWGVDFAVSKAWFNKINSVIWTTLDSLPILPSATAAAKKSKNFWVWSSFAEKAMHSDGLTHVKTVHCPLDASQFYKLPNFKKKELREKFDIPLDTFVIGFVFRNQLRKSVPNLLEGYKLFKTSHPEVKTKLILHTHWSEGWDLKRLITENKVDEKEILTTYICGSCRNYGVTNFSGQNIPCPFCGEKNSRVTTQPGIGVSEAQLNEVYNLMDTYFHVADSGGAEIPCFESLLTETVIAVTNYSFGEEICEGGPFCLPLEFSRYSQIDTLFTKASTYPSSISKQLWKVFIMKPEEKAKLGALGRQWVIDNYSIQRVGKFFEDFIDNSPEVTYDFKNEEEVRNPMYIIPQIQDNSAWLKDGYKNILRMTVDDDDNGLKYWLQKISEGMPREQIRQTFSQIAAKENETIEKFDFKDSLGADDEGKRIIYVMPEAIGDIFCSTSLFKSIKSQYPNHNLYVATKPEYFDILDGNPYVHKVLPYQESMNNLLWLEGHGKHKGFFEKAFLPYLGTQKMFDYQSNGKGVIAFDLKMEALL